MPQTLKVGPVTRIEGHLDIEVTLDTVNGRLQVVDAKSTGTMFRGFELILSGRDPRDAVHLTQRICGVCPVAHGMAASLTLEAAFKVAPTDNGRILRNLVLGANFLQSHVLHFYHLAALDYVNTFGILDLPPWTPRYITPDMVGGATAATLVDHYVQALAIRRKTHQMGAIFGGRLPCPASFAAGGCTQPVTAANVADFKKLLTEIQSFLAAVMVPDAEMLAAPTSPFAAYNNIGRGCGNLLAYGVFDQDAAGSTKLLKRGCYTTIGNAYAAVDPAKITEYTKYSYYSAASGAKNPSSGVTEPSVGKAGAYSWIKAPRYDGKVYEVGPLARMWVNGDYRTGISVMDRLVARAREAKKIADAMAVWLGQLAVGQATVTRASIPSTGTGIGLTEAARGALGHWMTLSNRQIGRYQIVTPTAWNASPMDDMNQKGAIEQALIGTPVADPTQPIELLRVVHSFDPCLACSVHTVRPGRRAQVVSTRTV